MGDELLESFESAQLATIRAVREVLALVQEGTTEIALASALEESVRAQGFDAWFQRPRVQFGAPATPRRWMREKEPLRPGTVVEIHLAPANRDAFGSLGHAFVFGSDEEPEVLREARRLCQATCGFSSRWKTIGEVFVYAEAWAKNHRYALDETQTVGHLCFPRRGRAGWLWPYGARTATLMRRHQVQFFNYRRIHGVLSLAPRLVIGDQGCTFGELVVVDGDTKRIVGRPGTGAGAIEQIGWIPAE